VTLNQGEVTMIDPKKLQCYTMAHRLSGYASGIVDKDRHDSLVHMLKKAAEMLEDVWVEYQLSLPEDQRVGEWNA
jgi:hypothetical protein